MLEFILPFFVPDLMFPKSGAHCNIVSTCNIMYCSSAVLVVSQKRDMCMFLVLVLMMLVKTRIGITGKSVNAISHSKLKRTRNLRIKSQQVPR